MRTLRHAAAVAGIDAAAAARAADVLAAAEVLSPGRPLEFVHPIVRAAVREDLADRRAGALHARAAEVLAGRRGARRAGGGAPARHGAGRAVLGRRAPAAAAARPRSAAVPRTARRPCCAARWPSPRRRRRVLRFCDCSAGARCSRGDDAGAGYYRSAIEATTDLAERAAMAASWASSMSRPATTRSPSQRWSARSPTPAPPARPSWPPCPRPTSCAPPGCTPTAYPSPWSAAPRSTPTPSPRPRPAAACSVRSRSTAPSWAGRWPAIAELATRAVAGDLPADPTTSNALWNCGVALDVADELTTARTWWDDDHGLGPGARLDPHLRPVLVVQGPGGAARRRPARSRSTRPRIGGGDRGAAVVPAPDVHGVAGRGPPRPGRTEGGPRGAGNGGRRRRTPRRDDDPLPAVCPGPPASDPRRPRRRPHRPLRLRDLARLDVRGKPRGSAVALCGRARRALARAHRAGPRAGHRRAGPRPPGGERPRRRCRAARRGPHRRGRRPARRGRDGPRPQPRPARARPGDDRPRRRPAPDRPAYRQPRTPRRGHGRRPRAAAPRRLSTGPATSCAPPAPGPAATAGPASQR